MAKYNMNDMLKTKENAQSTGSNATTIKDIDTSMKEVGKKDLGFWGKRQVAAHERAVKVQNAKGQIDVREGIAQELAIEAFKQQGQLIRMQMHDKYATQIGAIIANADISEMTAIRHLESIFSQATEVMLNDRYSEIVRTTERHEQGIISDEDLDQEIERLKRHYQKRRDNFEHTLEEQIAIIQGLRRDGSRKSFF